MSYRSRLARGFAYALLLHALVLGLALALHAPVFDLPMARMKGPVTVGLVHGGGERSGGGASGQKAAAAPKPPKAALKLADKPAPKGEIAPKGPAGPRLQLAPSFAQGMSTGGLGVLMGKGPPGQGNGEGRGDGAGAGQGGAGGGDDGYAVANSIGIEEEAKLYPFFSALWREIDSNLTYPEDLVQKRITGYVTAQLEVDRRGVFTGHIAKANSDHPLLETFVLATLFHALSEPLPENLWSSTRDKIVFVAKIDFHTFTWGQVPPPRAQKELKNVLEFERWGYTDPKINQEWEKFVTHYFPPIIILPGAVYIDVIRTYQMIQNFRNRDKMDADDLRLERIDLKREQWEELVRKGGPESEPSPGIVAPSVR